MNDATRREGWKTVVELAARIDAAHDTVDRGGRNVTGRIHDSRLGHLRSPSLEAGGSTSPPPRDDDASKPKEFVPADLRGKPPVSDPTGTAALQALNYGDQAVQDQKRLDRNLASMLKLLRESEDIVARYDQRTANMVEQQQEAEPGCASCSRVDSPGTVGLAKSQRSPWWSKPTRSTRLRDGTKVEVCNACYESVEVGVRWTGDLPPRDWVEYLRDNGRPRKRTA